MILNEKKSITKSGQLVFENTVNPVFSFAAIAPNKWKAEESMELLKTATILYFEAYKNEKKCFVANA